MVGGSVRVVGTVLSASRESITIKTAGGETKTFEPLTEGIADQLERSGPKLPGKYVNLLVVPRTIAYHLAEIKLQDRTMCEVHGKKIFKTEGEAVARLIDIAAKPQTKVIPIRAYLDPRCGNWHLTSQPLPETKE
jgi:hypothetical protein